MIADKPATVLLKPEAAALFLGLEVQTLAVWRSSKRYPLPYVRAGRAIRYRLSDLEKFLADRTVNSTGDDGGRAA